MKLTCHIATIAVAAAIISLPCLAKAEATARVTWVILADGQPILKPTSVSMTRRGEDSPAFTSGQHSGSVTLPKAMYDMSACTTEGDKPVCAKRTVDVSVADSFTAALTID